MTNFFAYVHAKPDAIDAFGVFYVGKGKDSRHKVFQNRNNCHQSIVKKYGQDQILIGKIDCSDEHTAFELEKGIIKCLKRMGVQLVNFTNGGDGAAGWKHSNETKLKIGAANAIALKGRKLPDAVKAKVSAAGVGRVVSEETRFKISIAQKGVPRKRHTEEWKRLMSERVSGKNHPLYGKPMSEETKQKIRETKKLRGKK